LFEAAATSSTELLKSSSLSRILQSSKATRCAFAYYILAELEDCCGASSTALPDINSKFTGLSQLLSSIFSWNDQKLSEIPYFVFALVEILVRRVKSGISMSAEFVQVVQSVLEGLIEHSNLGFVLNGSLRLTIACVSIEAFPRVMLLSTLQNLVPYFLENPPKTIDSMAEEPIAEEQKQETKSLWVALHKSLVGSSVLQDSESASTTEIENESEGTKEIRRVFDKTVTSIAEFLPDETDPDLMQ